MDRQYYINKHKELYDKCLEEASINDSIDVTEVADALYEDYATAEHVVGYYLCWFGDYYLETWEKNLSLAKERHEITNTDKEVTRILNQLN